MIKSPENYLVTTEISYQEQGVCSVWVPPPPSNVYSEAGAGKTGTTKPSKRPQRTSSTELQKENKPLYKKIPSLSILQTYIYDRRSFVNTS